MKCLMSGLQIGIGRSHGTIGGNLYHPNTHSAEYNTFDILDDFGIQLLT